MKIFKVLSLLLVVLCSSADAGTKEDAFQVVERWAKAFTAADVDTLVSLYASDAVFFGTVSKTIVTKPEDIKKYFQASFLGGRRFVATIVESAVTATSDTVVVVAALDKVVMTLDGKTTDSFGRVTYVLAKGESGWKIVSFHRSAVPS
jgi:uncharacterized protein (TIGR02246 family)